MSVVTPPPVPHVEVATPQPMGMTLPRWIGPGAVSFIVIWILLLLIGRAGMMRDPGTFWHTTTGEIILKEGPIRYDPFTFTFGGSWWVPHQWFAEVVMALGHRVGGFDLLLLGSVTILAAAFAVLSARLSATGLHPVAVGAIVALGLAAAGSHFHVRPHVFTIAALAFTAVLLADFDAGRITMRRLLWLIPLFAAWANIHGGFLGGFGTVVIAFAGWVVFWRLGRPSPVDSWRTVGHLGLLAIGLALTSLATPYGTEMLKAWRVIMGDALLPQIIKEHRPFDVSEPYAWPVMGLAAVYLFVLAGVKIRDVRVTWLLPCVWLLQSIERCRHVSLFVVVGLVAIAAIWPHTRWAAWLAKYRPDFYEPGSSRDPRPWWANVWLPAIAVAIAIVLQSARVSVPVIGSGWAQHSPQHWPVDVLEAMKVNEPKPGDPNRLFNDYADGGFAIFHTPGYKVFVDDRCEVFGGPWLVEFVEAGQKDTAKAMAKWEATYGQFHFALTRTGTGFDEYFKTAPGWECVKPGKTGSFYRRRSN